MYFCCFLDDLRCCPTVFKGKKCSVVEDSAHAFALTMGACATKISNMLEIHPSCGQPACLSVLYTINNTPLGCRSAQLPSKSQNSCLYRLKIAQRTPDLSLVHDVLWMQHVAVYKWHITHYKQHAAHYLCHAGGYELPKHGTQFSVLHTFCVAHYNLHIAQ